MEDLSDQIRHANSQPADIIELRMDAMDSVDFNMLKSSLGELKKTYVLSLRSQWLSHEIHPPNQGRIPFLRKLADMEPPYISIEYPFDMPIISELPKNTIPIITFVDFEGIAKIPFEVALTIVEKYENAILKISATPNTVTDLLTLWSFAKKCRKKGLDFILVGMGILGRILRLKSKEIGGLWTYGRVSSNYEEPKIPGMLHVNRILRGLQNGCRHILGLDYTDNYPVEIFIDNILANSPQPATFLNMEISQTPDIDRMLLWVNDGILSGVYIGKENQQLVLDKLDHKDQSVVYTNRCNTITNSSQGLLGYNTLVYGIKIAIENSGIIPKRVYIEGNKLNIKAFLAALRQYNLDEIVIRVEEEDIIPHIKSIHPKVVSHSQSFDTTFDVLINCDIPYTGFENVLPVSKHYLQNIKLIIDPLAKPSQTTPLSRYARDRNIKMIDGWDLFTLSMLQSIYLWTGEGAKLNNDDEEVMVERFFDFTQTF